MTNNILRFFMCLLLVTYVSCAFGGDVMPEEYIVKINGIEMRDSVAKKIFQYTKRSSGDVVVVHDAKDKNIKVSEVTENMDVVIEGSFMTLVHKLYQDCLQHTGVTEYKNKVCTPLHTYIEGRVRVSLCTDKDINQISSLFILES
jgi:hypothetical protein